MKLIKAASLLLGFGVILSPGIALADDVVSIGVLPGSSINVRGTVFAFGQDPPASTALPQKPLLPQKSGGCLKNHRSGFRRRTRGAGGSATFRTGLEDRRSDAMSCRAAASSPILSA